MPFMGAGVGQMNRKKSRQKKDKEKKIPKYGSFKYAIKTGVIDPRERYRMKLEQLKKERDAKRICSVCGAKAQYIDKKLFKKNVYYCENCKKEK
jgi:hypothetical protein